MHAPQDGAKLSKKSNRGYTMDKVKIEMIMDQLPKGWKYTGLFRIPKMGDHYYNKKLLTQRCSSGDTRDYPIIAREGLEGKDLVHKLCYTWTSGREDKGAYCIVEEFREFRYWCGKSCWDYARIATEEEALSFVAPPKKRITNHDEMHGKR